MIRARNGFSLVELLVVIGLLSLLAGLVLPAVQRTREAANRAACANNLKQIGLAFHQFEEVNNVFPPSREPCGATWAVLIMPYLEQDNLYKNWDFDASYYEQTPLARETPVAAYFCPSRRDARTPPLLSVSGDESPLGDSLGVQVPGALGDYAYNLGSRRKDTEQDIYDFYWFDVSSPLVTVPNLLSVRERRAKAILDRVGLNMLATGSVEVGEVVQQAPPAGTKVEPGSLVELLFAIRVPDVVGSGDVTSFTIAKKAIEANALILDPHGDEEYGKTFHQDPKPGTVVQAGTAVVVKFRIKVPEVEGTVYKWAEKFLVARGLKLNPSGDPEFGVAISQFPSKDTVVRRNAPVAVDFEIIVPPLEHKMLKQVMGIFKYSPLKLAIEGEPDDILEGAVISQTPVKGTIVKRGAVVSVLFKREKIETVLDGNVGGGVSHPHRSKGGSAGTSHGRGKAGWRGGWREEAWREAQQACSCGAQQVSEFFPYDGVAFGPVQITAGLSNTFLVGEKHVPLGTFGQGGWDSAFYNGTTFSCSGRAAGVSFPLAVSVRDPRWAFGSYHPWCCQFGFADGSVRALSVTIDPIILGRLANHTNSRVLPSLDE